MSTLRRTAANVRYTARNVAGAWGWSMHLLRVDPSMRERLVDASTQVCIEGFPRSGNTFLVRTFRHWNPDAVIGHHVHVPGQVSRAVRLGIPSIVVVRHPRDAIASLLVATPGLATGLAIASYTHFHRRVARHRARITVARFEDVVAAPWEVVEALNRDAGTSFSSRPLSESERTRILDDMRWWNEVDERQDPLLVPTPTEEKDRRKEALLPRLDAHPRLPAAIDSYEALAPA